MATPKRTQLLTKLQKVLKQNYKPVLPDTGRPILEQALFACCLENAEYAAAEKAFSRLGENYFDLNEVRVTTVAELAEALAPLPVPARAALSLRRVLQSVFESTYSFSLEHARKHSIAHGIKTLESLQGVPSFVMSFVVSTGLGGHTIPLDDGALAALWLTGLITREEYDARSAPWLDRAIPKKSGREFASLLHQLGADIMRNVHSPAIRKMVLAVDPEAKDRFPKRGLPLAPPAPAAGSAAAAASVPSEEHRPAGPQAAARPVGKTPMPPPGSGPKRTADGKSGKSGPKPFVVKPQMRRPQPDAAEVSQAEVKTEAVTPAKKKDAAKPADKAGVGKEKKPAESKASTKTAASGSGSKPAGKKSGGAKASGKAAAAKPGKGKPPAKPPAKPAAGKPAAKAASGHARQLAKRKPR
jgi:endonuclease III